MKVLLILDAGGGHVKPSDLRCVTAARKISQDVDIFVFCPKDAPGVNILQKTMGRTNTVYCCPLPEAQYQTAEHMTPTVLSVCENYSHIFASATSFGKNLLPRLAALLDVGMISDVVSILGPKHFKRPIYAGNALAEITTEDPFIVATMRPTAFDLPSFDSVMQGEQGQVEEVAHISSPIGLQTTWISLKTGAKERPDLVSAAVIVAGGRALGGAEGFQLIEQLADQFHGAVGASRAAVDAGYAPNDWQIGQTGKVVAPDLYIAIGISGAIQHVSGIKDSKVIVAINKDPEAPIFQVADIGLIADLFEAVPQLINVLQEER